MPALSSSDSSVRVGPIATEGGLIYVRRLLKRGEFAAPGGLGAKIDPISLYISTAELN